MRRPPSRHPICRRALLAAGVAAAVVLVPGVAWAGGGSGTPPPDPVGGLSNTLGPLLGTNDPGSGTSPTDPTQGDPPTTPSTPQPPPQLQQLLDQLQQNSQISPQCVSGVLQDVQVVIGDIPTTLQDLLAQLAAGLQQGNGGVGTLVPMGAPQPDGTRTLTLPAPQPSSSSGTGAVEFGSPSDLQSPPDPQNSQLANDLQKLVKDFQYNCLPQPPSLPTSGAPGAAQPAATPATQPAAAPTTQPAQYPGYAPTGGSGTPPPAGPDPLAAVGAALLLGGAGLAASRMHARAPRRRG